MWPRRTQTIRPREWPDRNDENWRPQVPAVGGRPELLGSRGLQTFPSAARGDGSRRPESIAENRPTDHPIRMEIELDKTDCRNAGTTLRCWDNPTGSATVGHSPGNSEC